MSSLTEFESTGFGLVTAAAVAYLALFVLVRASGRRTVSDLPVMGLLAATTAGGALGAALVSRTVTSLRGLTVAAVLILLEVALNRLAIYSPAIRSFVAGTPTVLVEKGKVLEGNLHRHSVTVDRLVQALRLKNAFHLSDVETAVLEPDGQLSVQLKADKNPVQPSQLGLSVTPAAGLARIVINDGVIRQDQLYALGRSETWLMQELAKQGHTNLQDIVVAQLDPRGRLYVDTANDFRQTQQPQDKQQILAGLRKLHTDLAAYSTETSDPAQQVRYRQDAAVLAQVLAEVTPHLRS